MKLKGKVYTTVVRPALLYGAETWANTRGQEARLEVNGMRMLIGLVLALWLVLGFIQVLGTLSRCAQYHSMVMSRNSKHVLNYNAGIYKAHSILIIKLPKNKLNEQETVLSLEGEGVLSSADWVIKTPLSTDKAQIAK